VDTQKVTCSDCKAKAEIAAPADGGWEDIGHERQGTVNPDGSTGVETLPTAQRVTWLCDSCGAANEIVRDVPAGKDKR
jgi:hypothetical protein